MILDIAPSGAVDVARDHRHEKQITGTRSYLLATFIGLFLAGSAFAQTTYYVSEMGNDRNDGLSEGTPWQSLSRVSRERLEPGDTVRFRSGDLFEGQLVISNSGTAEAPITFTRYGAGEKPLLDAGNPRRGAHVATVLIEDQDQLVISELKIRNFRKRARDGIDDGDAFGILIRNSGRRALTGYELSRLEIDEVYPIKRRRMFNRNTVSGIRFETSPAQTVKRAFNTSNIYIHDNVIRRSGRFGIAIRHRPSDVGGVRGTPLDFDENVRIINNLCEDLGGSCVLLNGVRGGLLESNTFLRSGSRTNQNVSVTRGSGAWFFRSRDIVAQFNAAIGSRGHNDSSGLHVDFGNKNVLVQYNFFYDNEGYGTEILGKNDNVIWRYNVSVGDGTRVARVDRPEGIKSEFPGKTIFVSDFAAPKRLPSSNIHIYNNTYVTFPDSAPQVEINGVNVALRNNAFIATPGSRIGSRVLVVWNDDNGSIISNNLFSGAVAPALIAMDDAPHLSVLAMDVSATSLEAFAIPSDFTGEPIVHPPFPAAGKGVFSHITEIPKVDIFGNLIAQDAPVIGAGTASESP